jgi:hypothetical protein
VPSWPDLLKLSRWYLEAPTPFTIHRRNSPTRFGSRAALV